MAREAQLCYAGLALVTDYDCWHESEETVSADLVAQTMRRNVSAAREVLQEVVSAVDVTDDCECRHALSGAVLTDPALIDPSRGNWFGPPSC